MNLKRKLLSYSIRVNDRKYLPVCQYIHFIKNMRLAGNRPKEKYHSYKGQVGKIADNIINRDFSTIALLQKWTTDISQVKFLWGKCYLSPFLDMNTNVAVSYIVALRSNLEQISRMLNRALKNTLIFRGWFSALIRDGNTKIAILRTHSRNMEIFSLCREKDNVMIILWWKIFCRLKTEIYYGCETECLSFNAFAVAIEEYIDCYNNKRIQKKTHGCSL